MYLIGPFVAAIFARAFFEPALAAIGTNIVESAVAGSDEVGSAVVGLSAGAGSVDAGLFITSLIFGAGVPVCVILYFYPATCGPKGHGSGSAAA